MTHSDDNGLVLPPKLAPNQVVIIPIFKSDKELNLVLNYIKPLLNQLKKENISFLVDQRDSYKPGYKFNEYEIKGVPIRLVIGPKDVGNSSIEIFRRDKMEKETLGINEAKSKVLELIDDIQKNIYNRALSFRNNNIRAIDDYNEFKKIIKNNGGFVSAHWDGTQESEEKIKKETKATIRCIPFEDSPVKGKCIISGKPSKQRVLFAKAY